MAFRNVYTKQWSSNVCVFFPRSYHPIFFAGFVEIPFKVRQTHLREKQNSAKIYIDKRMEMESEILFVYVLVNLFDNLWPALSDARDKLRQYAIVEMEFYSRWAVILS